MLYFENDYSEGAHEKVLARLVETNMEQLSGYGMDPYSESAKEKIRRACDCPEADIYFLAGGTQTNQCVISSMLNPYEGVIAAESGHIGTHEAGAIENSGHKVITLPQENGKLSAETLADYLSSFYGDENHDHMVYQGMVYISHPTEYGTLYTKGELAELSDVAEYCDVFYIGGTKIGTLFGEAVVVTRPDLLKNFIPLVKQHGALLAKGRLLGVQFETLFTDGLYMAISRHAVNMAMKLKKAFTDNGYRLFIDSPTNQQFVYLPNEEIDRLRKIASFELWGPRKDKETPVRMVTSWATREEDVDEFISHLRKD